MMYTQKLLQINRNADSFPPLGKEQEKTHRRVNVNGQKIFKDI